MNDNRTKLLRVLSIVSLSIMALALLSFFCCVILQKPLVSLFLKNTESIGIFLFPADIFCSLVAGLLLSGVLIPVAGNKKIGVWADILIVAFSAIIKPVCVYFISLARNVLFTRTALAMGSSAVSFNSSLNSAVSLFTSFASVGVVVLYVVCGMSIILKLSAKQKENLTESGIFEQIG